MFVVISSMSFLIPPTAYPARFGMLLTTLLVQLILIIIIFIITKVLVNMFTSVLLTTPSDSKGLTALAIWILSTILLVFTALLLYIVVLIEMRRVARRTSSNENERRSLDLDPVFLAVHLTMFAIFLLTYTIVFASI